MEARGCHTCGLNGSVSQTHYGLGEGDPLPAAGAGRPKEHTPEIGLAWICKTGVPLGFWGFFFLFVGQVNSSGVDLFQVIGGQFSCRFLLPATVSLGGFAASYHVSPFVRDIKSESSFCKVMGE